MSRIRLYGLFAVAFSYLCFPLPISFPIDDGIRQQACNMDDVVVVFMTPYHSSLLLHNFFFCYQEMLNLNSTSIITNPSLGSSLLCSADAVVDYIHNLPFIDAKSVLIGNAFYFCTIFLLMKFMQNRERFNPKRFMILYNFTCVCLATYCFVGVLRYYFLKGNPLFCSNVDFFDADARAIVRVYYVFYLQKYWEFIDTFLFILRKSYRQVTFLHVYHHSSITVMVSLFIHFYPAGDNCVPVLLNSFVHMLMYSHYLCSIMGIKCWWRSLLTLLQLVQFVLIVVVNGFDLVK